jgi:hypothetical protein
MLDIHLILDCNADIGRYISWYNWFIGIKVKGKTKSTCNEDELLGDIKDMDGVIKLPNLKTPDTSLLYIDIERAKKDTLYLLNCVNERLLEDELKKAMDR